MSETGSTGLGAQASAPPIIGVLFTILAPLTAAMSAHAMRWGADLSKKVKPEPHSIPSPSLELACVLAATIPVNVAGAILTHTVVTFSPVNALIAFAGGLILNTGSIIPWRKANVITTDLGVNVAIYATTALSLTWLWLLGMTTVARPDLLILGAATIIATNLIINTSAAANIRFTATATTIWLLCTAAYIAATA